MRRSRVLLSMCLFAGLAMTAPVNASATGSIGGTVTDEAGLPLAGICVAAGDVFNRSYAFRETAADGTYSMTGLRDGEYALVFRDCSDDPQFLTEWYDDQNDFNAANVVPVSGGSARTGVDATLGRGGFISGTLLDDDGAPAVTCVAAYSDLGGWIDIAANTSTQFETGSYRIGPLPSGDVVLEFGNCDARVPISRWTFPVGAVIGMPIPASSRAPQGYVPEWYNNWRGGGDRIPVVPGVETPDINAELAIAGGLLGIVTDEAGNPLKDICVSVDADPFYGFATTDENGFYTIGRLAAGSYRVVFYDCTGGTYRSEWYDNVPSSLLAEEVTVVRKTWTRSIDGSLGRRPRPDLAITGLRVSSVPIEASGVGVAGSPWLRTIEVDIANLGTAAPGEEANLRLWAVSRSDGATQSITEDRAVVHPGATEHRSYDWNGFGTIGDVTIYAVVCAYDDADRGNDRAQARSYVVIGGLGAGYTPDGTPGPVVSWCGPVFILDH